MIKLALYDFFFITAILIVVETEARKINSKPKENQEPDEILLFRCAFYNSTTLSFVVMSQAINAKYVTGASETLTTT